MKSLYLSARPVTRLLGRLVLTVTNMLPMMPIYDCVHGKIDLKLQGQTLYYTALDGLGAGKEKFTCTGIILEPL